MLLARGTALAAASVHRDLEPGLARSRVRGFPRGRGEELGPALPRHLKSEERRLKKVDLGGQRYRLRVGLKENVSERRAKVGSVQAVRRLRNVEFFALGAEDFDAVLAQLVAHRIRHNLLLVTKSPRAVSVGASLILAVDESQP